MVGSFARCLLFTRCEGSLNSLVPLSGLGISANSVSRARYVIAYIILLYEYKDLFIDMDVGKNRSELAIANRHQER